MVMEVLVGIGTSLMVVWCQLGMAAFIEPEMLVECDLTARTEFSHQLESTAVRCLMQLQTELSRESMWECINRVQVLFTCCCYLSPYGLSALIR